MATTLFPINLLVRAAAAELRLIFFPGDSSIFVSDPRIGVAG